MAKMRVLLTQDVEKLGKAGEIKMVSGGYGRNYLLPQGMAVLATPGLVKQAEERLAARRRREAAERQVSEALVDRLNGVTLRFEERVGELDRLYGSVTNADIAAKLQEQLGIEIDRRKIDLTDPIKRIGNYPVQVQVASGLHAMLNVVVEGTGGQVAAEAEPATPAALADSPAADEPMAADTADAEEVVYTPPTDDTDDPTPTGA